MNSFEGVISEIKVSKDLSLVTVDVGHGIFLKSIVIETPDTARYLRDGYKVKVLFKETEVVLGISEIEKISLQNRIKGIIISIDEGKLISKVTLSTSLGRLTSIISTNAVHQLSLTKDTSVTAMIKLNEIMLSE